MGRPAGAGWRLSRGLFQAAGRALLLWLRAGHAETAACRPLARQRPVTPDPALAAVVRDIGMASSMTLKKVEALLELATAFAWPT